MQTARSLLRAVPAVLLVACVAPTTQLGHVTRDDVRNEQLKQQQLVLQSALKEQQRLEDVAYPIRKAAVPFCGAAAAPFSGVRFMNLQSWAKPYQAAAQSLGFTDTLVVINVVRGSPAEEAGVRVGDRILGAKGRPAPTGTTAVRDFALSLAPSNGVRSRPTAFEGDGSLHLTLHRGSLGAPGARIGAPLADSLAGAAAEITLPAVPVCNYGLTAAKDDMLNAWADGQNVTVTTAMMRFAADDDELAVVVAHELSHNAMRHMDAQRKNAGIGAIFGAILDVAAATQGVNTQGSFTNQGAQLGATTFSQDFEREADYVGLYLLARAGRPLDVAPNFWRRMAQESPGSIKFASTHPTTAERFIRLEQAMAEIEQKRAAGAELSPTLKSDAKKR